MHSIAMTADFAYCTASITGIFRMIVWHSRSGSA